MYVIPLNESTRVHTLGIILYQCYENEICIVGLKYWYASLEVNEHANSLLLTKCWYSIQLCY